MINGRVSLHDVARGMDIRREDIALGKPDPLPGCPWSVPVDFTRWQQWLADYETQRDCRDDIRVLYLHCGNA